MPERRAVVVVLAAVAFGLAAQYLVVRERAGVNVLVATALFLGLAWRLGPPVAAPRPREAWLPASALAFAACCAIRTDAPLVAFDAAAALALSLGSLAAFRGVAISTLPFADVLREAGRTAVAVAWRMAGQSMTALPAMRRDAAARSRRASGYGAGVLLAVPFLVVFGALFSSADAVFGRTVADVFGAAWLRELLMDLPARLTVAALAAWAVGGALALAGDRDEPGPGAARRGWLGGESATAMLVAIDLLFGFFVVLQVAYLFGGRETLAASGVPYAEYARRGFFELVGVTALVAALLFAVDLALRERGRAYRAAALALVALTGVVLASAALRLDLYQRAYGWTELRFYAGVAIVFLAAALALLAWAVLRARMATILQRLATAGVAVALAANAIGPSAVVARANIARAVEPASLAVGASREVDLAYLVSLGDGAMPVLAASLSALPEPERGELERRLRLYALRRAAPGGWQSWNLDRERAREALR